MGEILVEEGKIHGELYLSIEQNQLIEKYCGGIVGMIKGDRIRYLPLITLTGVKMSGLTLSLSFEQKEG